MSRSLLLVASLAVCAVVAWALGAATTGVSAVRLQVTTVEYVQPHLVDDLNQERATAIDQQADDVDLVEVEADAESAPKKASGAAPNKAAAGSAGQAAPKAPKKARVPVRRLTKAQFRKMLNTKAPKRRSGGKGVKPKPKKAAAGAAAAGAQAGAQQPSGKAAAPAAAGHKQAAAPRPRFAEVDASADMEAVMDAAADAEAEAEAEQPSGGAGGQAGKSGGSAGKSGGSAGDAGGAAGKSGGSAGKSGGSAGDSGGAAAKSGGSAGYGSIVAPTSHAAGLSFDGSGMDAEQVDAKYGAGFFKSTFWKGPIKLSTAARAMPTQGECGSCWAQSAIGSLEDMLKKTQKYREPLSIQAAIDCVKSSESAGCEGGTPMDVLEYFRTHPLATEREYPYTGVVGACVESKGGVLSGGWAQVGTACQTGACTASVSNELIMMQQLQKPNAVPLIAYVDATNWQDYTNGMFPAGKCSSTADAGNHVVQIIGFGAAPVSGSMKADLRPYWLVKNSWGSAIQ